MSQIPEYWKEHLQKKIATIHKHQSNAGKNSASFALITDMHWEQNEHHSAALLQKILFDCSIPYFLNAGDLVSGHGLCPEQELYEEISDYRENFASIESKCLIALGNHDMAYSTFDAPLYYMENAPMQRFYEYYFRPMTMYCGRTFSEDGTYYYADDKAHKIRYIVLNSQEVISEESTEEGYAKYNRMRNYGFLQAQIDWLANVALQVPADVWFVVVCSHAGRITLLEEKEENEYNYSLVTNVLKAFNDHTAYTGEKTYDNPLKNAKISVDFTGKGGNLVGWFSGHSHRDRIQKIDGVMFVETTTDASYVAFLHHPGIRGTTNEHAFYVFTVDKATRTVYVTRICKGEDITFQF